MVILYHLTDEYSASVLHVHSLPIIPVTKMELNYNYLFWKLLDLILHRLLVNKGRMKTVKF